MSPNPEPEAVHTEAQAPVVFGVGQGVGAVRMAQAQPVPGHLFGLAQSSLLVRLQWAPGAVLEGMAERLLAAVAPRLPAVAGFRLVPLAGREGDAQADAMALLSALAAVVHRLQFTADLPALPEARLLDAAPGQATLALPGPNPAAVRDALEWALQALTALANDSTLPPDTWAAHAQLHQRLNRLAPGGNNQRHLLRTAYALGMPVLVLPGEVAQFGWGRRSRLFRSTITDATGSIATGWAKNKHHTNALLRMAGLPVPAQVVVNSLESALAAAARLGYPVVLKPVNLDQGEGVEAGIRNEAELCLAHPRSSQHAKTLLVEKHVPGDDHRVNVVLGEVVGVARRTPARVCGDGLHSVTELVAALNRERKRRAVLAAMYKPIEVDDEALEMLARDGLDANSVPAAGTVVALRRTANVSRGGTSEDVTEQIHPDNAALCVQAAALLRLDIAGLDLLITDISRSWREVGGAFCEINAQPQTGAAHPWMFEKILRRYVVGRGRVPTVLVLGGSDAIGVAQALVAAMAQTAPRAALVQGNGLALLQGCRAELMAPDLGGLVVLTDGTELARWGLPLDRFDVLVVTDPLQTDATRSATLALLEPHTAQVRLSGPGQALEALRQRWGDSRMALLEDEAALVRSVMHALAERPEGG